VVRSSAPASRSAFVISGHSLKASAFQRRSDSGPATIRFHAFAIVPPKGIQNANAVALSQGPRKTGENIIPIDPLYQTRQAFRPGVVSRGSIPDDRSLVGLEFGPFGGTGSAAAEAADAAVLAPVSLSVVSASDSRTGAAVLALGLLAAVAAADAADAEVLILLFLAVSCCCCRGLTRPLPPSGAATPSPGRRGGYSCRCCACSIRRGRCGGSGGASGRATGLGRRLALGREHHGRAGRPARVVLGKMD